MTSRRYEQIADRAAWTTYILAVSAIGVALEVESWVFYLLMVLCVVVSIVAAYLGLNDE